MIYTNLSREEIKNGESADFVLILGQDANNRTDFQQFFKKIISTCQQQKLKYYILGDGKNPINLQEIYSLPESNNLFINCHGDLFKKNTNKNRHVITLNTYQNSLYTLEFIKNIQDITKSKNIIFGTCFGGKVVAEFKKTKTKKKQLMTHTFFFTPSSAKEISFIRDNNHIIHHFIQMLKPNEHPSFIHLIKDSIDSNPQTMLFAYQSDQETDSLKTHKIRRKYRDKKKIFLQAENYIDYLQQQFNNFIKETTQDRQCLELKKSFEQYELDYPTIYSTEIKNKRFTLIERFKSMDLINYMLHNDIKVLKNLLENAEKKQAQNIITQLLSHLAKFKLSKLLHNMIDLINSYQPDIYSLHTSEKISILEYLIQINNIDLLEAILEKNPTIQNEYNQFPLDYIIQQNEDDLIERILSIPGVILSPYYHENKLTNALKLKTLVHEREWFSDAIRDSNINMIKNLLDCNINIDLNTEEDETGKTPLMVAVFWDDEAIAALLIKHGAQLNITSSIDGTTALLLAVENNNITMVHLLLNKGADPNQANTLNGTTPLHIATKNNNLPLIKLLIQAKANSNLKDFSNKKPKHYVNLNQMEIAGFFEKIKIATQKIQTQETAGLYNFFPVNMHETKLLNENSLSKKCVLI